MAVLCAKEGFKDRCGAHRVEVGVIQLQHGGLQLNLDAGPRSDQQTVLVRQREVGLGEGAVRYQGGVQSVRG